VFVGVIRKREVMVKKLEKKIIEDIFALTPMQEGMLFHYLKEPESNQYFEQLSLAISGEIDVETFKKAWNFVIETNEILRAVFRWEKVETPVQIILKEHKLQPGYYDFSGYAVREKKRKLEEIKVNDKKQKFDLRNVAFRVTLCKLEKDKYEIIISNYHILYDGWSSGIILREFFNAYNDLANGSPLVKPIKTKFKEFVKWIQKQDTNREENFWREYLKDFDTNRGLALKRKKKKEIKSKGSHEFEFPFEVKDGLEDFVKKHKISLASLLYCAWGMLLQKYNSSNDVLFDTTVSGRTAKIEGIEDIVGLFINTLPLRVRAYPGEEISRLLSRIDQSLQQRREFENSSLLHINEYLDTCFKENLFDSVVVIENYPLDLNRILRQGSSALSINSFSFSGSTYYDLTVIITPFEDYKVNITYNRELFDEESLLRLFKLFTGIIHDMLTNPGKKVDETGVAAEEERSRLLAVLSDAGDKAEFPGVKYTMPRDECERKLVHLWANLLRVEEEKIGIDSDFFDFGGHSLRASVLAGRIHQEFKVKMPPAEIFRRPTIKELARYIRRRTRGRKRILPFIISTKTAVYAFAVEPGKYCL
jgi:acyl carrier protein